MKSVTVRELKEELLNCSPNELRDLCLRLSKFRKENKELLTYLLFESSDEEGYIRNVKINIDEQFSQINKKSYYTIRKGLRKVLTFVRRYIRYSRDKKTEVELLIYFNIKLRAFTPSIKNNVRLQNLYNVQMIAISKKISMLHEDLQFDYISELEELNEN